MKKVLIVLICLLLASIPVYAESKQEMVQQDIKLMDSEELFTMIQSFLKTNKTVSIQTTLFLDELEQEKYDSFSSIEGLSEENRIIIAKMMAFRYREAQEVSKIAFKNIFFGKIINLNATNSSTSPLIAGYYVQNKPVAIQLYEDYMYILSNHYIENRAVVATMYRDQQFISYVKSNGPWDLKGFIGKDATYNLLGFSRTGEYIGNHHYGYMGRHAGYNRTYLEIGAGIYQIVSRTSDWSFMSSYFDDPLDNQAIIRGYSDYSIDLGLGIFY